MPACVRLGLLGLGSQGRQHLEAARDLDALRFVSGCDLDPDARAMVADAYPGLSLHHDLSKMLQAEALDGLVLALPHGAYGPIWPLLATIRLPLLKEKPLGITVQEAQAFLAQVSAAGGFLKTALQRRHHPSYACLHRILNEIDPRHQRVHQIHALHGELHLGLSEAQEAEAWRGDPAQAGGGALLDCGYHLVDLVQYLLGPFSLVSAQLWKNGRPTSPDEVETEASVHGLAGHTWIRLHVWRQGHEDPDRPGKRLKHEGVVVETDRGIYRANRQGVWRDGDSLMDCERDWQEAMKRQLQEFADDILRNNCDTPEIWGQVPTMRAIQQAYALARQYHVALP